MNETWKDISGYEGLYQVSNLGRIMSLKKIKGIGNRILKLSKSHNGYSVVILSKNGKLNNYKVHRLVASEFISNQYNLPEVNHIDEDKNNNFVENLEWCTQIYNLRYGTRAKKISLAMSRPIVATNIESGEKLYFKSLRSALKYGFTLPSMIKCLKGLSKQYKGFIWVYICKEGN